MSCYDLKPGDLVRLDSEPLGYFWDMNANLRVTGNLLDIESRETYVVVSVLPFVKGAKFPGSLDSVHGSWVGVISSLGLVWTWESVLKRVTNLKCLVYDTR